MTSDSSSLVLVQERFAGHVDILEHLYKKSESFQSLCEDYQECLALHDRCSRSTEQEAAVYQKDYAILLQELEKEILEYVERKGAGLIDYQSQETEF